MKNVLEKKLLPIVSKGTQFFIFPGWHIGLPTYLSETKFWVFFPRGRKKKLMPKSSFIFPRLSFFFPKKGIATYLQERVSFFCPGFFVRKKKQRSAPGPLGDFFIVSFKNSVSFYFVKKIRKLPSILYDNCL